MTKNLRFASVLLVSAVIGLVSCKKDDDPSPVVSVPGPTVSFVKASVPNANNIGDLQQDSTAALTVRAQSAKGLKSFVVKKRVGSLEFTLGEAALVDSNKRKDVTITIPYTYSDTSSSVQIVFIATDSADKVGRYTFTYFAAPFIKITNAVTNGVFPKGSVAPFVGGGQVTITANTRSGTDITAVNLYLKKQNGSVSLLESRTPAVFDSPKATTEEFTYTLPLNVTRGIISFIVETVNNTGHKSSTSIVYNVLSPTSSLTNVSLCAQSCNSFGNFFSTLDGVTYKSSDPNAAEYSGTIDLVYYYDSAANKSYLASPTYAKSANQYNSTLYGPGNWSLKRSTQFRKNVDVDAFNENVFTDPTSDGRDRISELFTGGGSDGQLMEVKEVSAANPYLIAYKNQSGRYGLIKVNSIVPGANGKVNFDIRYSNY
ncbi:MAG: hypothetical protein V4543_05155 [Bacteroidota bacterium]